MKKICEICGCEYDATGRNRSRQKYCGKRCQQMAGNNKRRRYTSSLRATDEKRRMTDIPIKYSSEEAQASHNRQADIERKARAAGLSYGRYQMMKYMERMVGE